MRVPLICLAAFLFLADPGSAAGAERDRSVTSDLGAVGTTVGRGWTQPLRWDGTDWLLFGGAVGLGFASALLDDEVREPFRKNRGRFGDSINDLGFQYGKPQTQLAGGLALYVPGAIAGSDWLRDTGQMILANVFVAGVPQQALRVLAGRARPRSGLGNRAFELFDSGDDHASFISGHTALAVGSSVILARQIGHPAATVPLIAMAATTPVARLYHDVHWFSDVVVGALLGWFSGNFVCDALGGESGLARRVSFVPEDGGLSLRLRF